MKGLINVNVLRDVIMSTLGNTTKPKDQFAKFVRTAASARETFVYLFVLLSIKKYTVSLRTYLSLFTVF